MGNTKNSFTPLVERHYVLPGSTENLPGVATEIPQELYENMARKIELWSSSTERSLGRVVDKTRYYHFSGSNVFLSHGLAQAGTAITTDKPKGFSMIRLFSNSLDDMYELASECGGRRDTV